MDELDVCEPDHVQLEVIDLGDFVVETKQQFPNGQFADCVWVFGTRPNC